VSCWNLGKQNHYGYYREAANPGYGTHHLDGRGIRMKDSELEEWNAIISNNGHITTMGEILVSELRTGAGHA